MEKNARTRINTGNFWSTIAQGMKRAAQSNQRPVMVIDIDGTIAEHFLRTQQIFIEAIKELELPESFKKNLNDFDPFAYDYNPKPNLIEMGLEGETLAKMIKYWNKYFFSNKFLHLDNQIEGGSEFVHKILGLDIDVIYLTGRDEQNMGEGTRVWLTKNNFMNEHYRTSILMKTNLDIENVDSKALSAQSIQKVGEPVLIIDNEPCELEAMWDQFPRAATILMDTPNSGRPATLPDYTYKMKDYLELNSLFEG
ncbi:MAG: hypothetical protein GY839_05945 [candidate division Zixibacteria bacterium]|nr:hypothetical protein [candidate division Zixibacteria bacterium]